MEAAPDFRVLWDNAYAEHHLVDQPAPLANILDACALNDHPDRVLMFASTSKISFGGSGIAAMGASANNISEAIKKIRIRTIGSDKLNQLRHIHFFRNLESLRSHMKAHAKILKPKFDLVDEILHRELGGKQIARWSKPDGGYFVNLDVPDGCARKTISLATESGVVLTPAGSSFPNGFDPNDRNIRIAPTFPQLSQIKEAIEIIVICVELVAIQQQLKKLQQS
jgi:DNA-binding transcriptional MocR family regulator